MLFRSLRDADGRLLRSWQAGRAHLLAYAEDHAALLAALVTLAELDDLAWLDDARSVADALVERFGRPGGGFFTTAADAEILIARTLDLQDNATPSANGLAADALLRLADLTGEARHREAALGALRLSASVAVEHPLSFAQTLVALERAQTPTLEVALVGDADRFEAALASRLLPATVTVRARRDDDATRSPLLADRPPVDGRATAYVCEGGTCRLPVTDVDAMVAEIEAILARRR